MNEMTANALTRKRNLDWLSNAFLVLVFSYIARSNWYAVDVVVPTSAVFVLFGVILFFLCVGVLFQRLLSRKSWASILSYSGGIEPRDEREWQLFGRASQYGFSAGFLIVLLAATFLLMVPPASKLGMVYFLFVVFELQLMVRGFIAWALGLR